MAKKKSAKSRRRKPAPVVDEMAKYHKKFVWDSKKKKLVEIPRRIGTTNVARWPIHSDSMGVLPRQREQLANFLASQGVPTEVDAGGRPILTGPAHRKAVEIGRAHV